ncbi:MAG: hypothetical protein ACRC5A_05950, partial [Enterobacteriaceae bacterium]
MFENPSHKEKKPSALGEAVFYTVLLSVFYSYHCCAAKRNIKDGEREQNVWVKSDLSKTLILQCWQTEFITTLSPQPGTLSHTISQHKTTYPVAFPTACLSVQLS